jgi:ribosome-associated translation inhibitor RaiA
MNIIIKKSLDLTPALEEYIGKKFAPLEKLVEGFKDESALTLYFEIARISNHHNKGEEIFSASAAIALPRQGVRGEATAPDARIAIDRTRDVLREEIEKYKAKHFDNYRSEKER